MKSKIKILILEGADGTGKTAIKKYLSKVLGGKYIIFDRFTASKYVYDKLFGRDLDEDALFEAERDMLNHLDIKLVYLSCAKATAVNRTVDDTDNSIKYHDDAIKLFDEYLSKTPFRHMRLDTTYTTVEEAAEEIVEFMAASRTKTVIDTLVKKYSNLIQGGEIVNTVDVIDMSSVDLLEEVAAVEDYYKFIGHSYEERLKMEENFYNQLYYQLKHKIEETQFFFNQGLESRKNIVFTNDCISMLHLLKHKDEFILNVYMRSSDVYSLFFSDVYNIMKIFQKLVGNNGKIVITVGNLHSYSKFVKAYSEVKR